MSEEKSPTIREALADFQQALDNYEAAQFLERTTWNKVLASSKYSAWQEAVDRGDPTTTATTWSEMSMTGGPSALWN